MSAPSFVSFVSALGVQLTPAQRVIGRVAFDGVAPIALPPSERELSRSLFGPIERVPDVARATFVAVCGARGGKSYIFSALRLLHLGLTVDLDGLADGERAFAPIVAPDLRLARQTLRYAVGAVDSTRSLAALVVERTADSITLRRHDHRMVTFEVLPATRGGSALRGRTLAGAALDEAAFFRDDASVVNDSEIFAAVAPRVVPRGQVLIVSTPWSSAGILYDLHRENFGRPSTALVAHAPTILLRDGHPAIVAMITRERARDPRNASREYDARFLAGETNLLLPEDVDAAIDIGVHERAPREDCTYALTIDVAWRVDGFAAMVFHIEDRERENAPPIRVLVVDAVRILKPAFLRRIAVEDGEELVASLARRYRVARVVGDGRDADSFGARLRARGFTFVEAPMHPAAQARRAASLVARFASGAIRLPDHTQLIRECKEVRRKLNAGGTESIGAPDQRGKHDDAFDCLMLAEEQAHAMPALGGDIEVSLRVDRDDSRITLHPEWTRRIIDRQTGETRLVPCLPPRGTVAWREQLDALTAEGIRVPDHDLLDVERDLGRETDGVNVPIVGG